MPLVANRISATILTKDSARRLGDVLDALAWCDEVIVLDTGSSDTTVDIAKARANTRVHSLCGDFSGFGRAHRHAAALARNDWILSIDSDEVLSTDLADEIAGLRLCSKTVYAFRFHNYFNGRLITSCGWYPERHERLFDRRTTDFCESEIHEKVKTRGLAVETLRHPVRHYSYACSDDFLRKMRAYTALFVAQNAGRKQSGPGKAIGHGVWTFLKSYLLQKGFTQGFDGFLISAYKAQSTFWKYVALGEANRVLEVRE